jgi:hypothetical protein
MAICYFYLEADAPFPSEWYGADGAIASVHKKIGLANTSSVVQRIRKVFEEVLYCLRENMEYDGYSRKQKSKEGRPPIIHLYQVGIANLVAS